MKKSTLILGFTICVLMLIGIGGFFFLQKPISSSKTANTPSATALELRALKENWKNIIVSEGGELAYAKFIKQASESLISTHEQAHSFGEALYEAEGINGLRACDSSFEFGCYHSFFGVAVQAEGIEVLPQFDEACRTKYGDYNLPCQHGIGHGILVYTDYTNLVKALELCETISTLPTGGCSSGVFMEYNFHSMDESENGSYLRVQEEDLYAPCNMLPLRFQASCYNEQVQWWQSIFNSDFGYIGTLCQTLPSNTDVSEACFHGMGNYIAANEELNLEKINEQCSRIENENGVALCHEGASWLVRGDGSGIDSAQAICNSLTAPFKESCLIKLLR